MRVRSEWGLLCVLALGLAGCGAGRVTAATEPAAAGAATPTEVALTPAEAPIALRMNPVADAYFWLRAKALEGEAPAPFGEALEAMKTLRAELVDEAAAWEDLEVPLADTTHARVLTLVYGELPVTIDVGGRPVPLRQLALRLARALEATEGAYLRGPWREHLAAAQRATRGLEATFSPRAGAILDAAESELALPSVSRPLVVTVVYDAPFPSAFAADARGRESAIFVRARGFDGERANASASASGTADFAEAVLHGALHAMDELSVRTKSTAMNELRTALGGRGLDAEDANGEMAVNTVTFAEAASLVRRFVDPGHRPLGESGFYTLFPPAAEIVAAWDKRVAGQNLDATIQAIAEIVAP